MVDALLYQSENARPASRGEVWVGWYRRRFYSGTYISYVCRTIRSNFTVDGR